MRESIFLMSGGSESRAQRLKLCSHSGQTSRRNKMSESSDRAGNSGDMKQITQIRRPRLWMHFNVRTKILHFTLAPMGNLLNS